MGDFVLFREDVERIQKTLSHLLTESASSFVLLIHRDGNLLSQVGFNTAMDVTGLSALAAGSFASTRAIAAIIGENEFTMMIHQGEKQNICITLVDEDAILLIVFDERTNLGMVKLVSVQSKNKLVEILNDVRRNEFGEASPGDDSQGVSDRIDSLFGNA